MGAVADTGRRQSRRRIWSNKSLEMKEWHYVVALRRVLINCVGITAKLVDNSMQAAGVKYTADELSINQTQHYVHVSSSLSSLSSSAAAAAVSRDHFVGLHTNKLPASS